MSFITPGTLGTVRVSIQRVLICAEVSDDEGEDGEDAGEGDVAGEVGRAGKNGTRPMRLLNQMKKKRVRRKGVKRALFSLPICSSAMSLTKVMRYSAAPAAPLGMPLFFLMERAAPQKTSKRMMEVMMPEATLREGRNRRRCRVPFAHNLSCSLSEYTTPFFSTLLPSEKEEERVKRKSPFSLL